MITFVMYNCAVTITVTFVLHYGAPVSVTLDKKSRINLHLSFAVISCCALTICPHHVHFLYCHTVSHRLRFRGLIFSAWNHISYKTAFPTLNKSFTPFFLEKEAIKQHKLQNILPLFPWICYAVLFPNWTKLVWPRIALQCCLRLALCRLHFSKCNKFGILPDFAVSRRCNKFGILQISLSKNVQKSIVT